MTNLDQIDDQTVEWILTTIARAHSTNLPDFSKVRSALANQFQIIPSHDYVSDGDLARQALHVLAENRETQSAIGIMANQGNSGRHDRFDVGTATAIGAAAYFALSSAIDFERDKEGRWSFKFKIKPAGEAAVKKLVEKLIRYLPE